MPRRRSAAPSSAAPEPATQPEAGPLATPPAAPRTVRSIDATVQAGFPSPAADYTEEPIDLAAVLVPNPTATFVMRVRGDSMVDAGIQSGDLLVVDRSIEPAPGMVVIAAVDGEFTCKRLRRLDGVLALCAANDAFPPILMTGDMELRIWGVVSYVIHRPA